MEQLVQPVVVLVVRPSSIRGTIDLVILIHWYDLPAYEDSWESFAAIQTQFPHFNLKDKVRAWATGNDRPSIQITYERRKKGKSISSDISV